MGILNKALTFTLLAAGVATQAQGKFSALCYNGHTGGYGVSVDKDTKDRAIQSAKGGTPGSTQCLWTSTCVAVFWDSETKKGYWDTWFSRKGAEYGAEGACKRAGDSCRYAGSVCSYPHK